MKGEKRSSSITEVTSLRELAEFLIKLPRKRRKRIREWRVVR